MSDARALYGQDGSVTVLASPCDASAARTHLGFAANLDRAATLISEAGYTFSPGEAGRWQPVDPPPDRPAYAVDVQSPLKRPAALEGNNPSSVPPAERITNAIAAALTPVPGMSRYRAADGTIDIAGVAGQDNLGVNDQVLCDLALAIQRGDGQIDLGRHLAYLRDVQVRALVTAIAATRGWTLTISTTP